MSGIAVETAKVAASSPMEESGLGESVVFQVVEVAASTTAAKIGPDTGVVTTREEQSEVVEDRLYGKYTPDEGEEKCVKMNS